MPERPTYDGFEKMSLLDPEQLREQTDVLFHEETRVVNDRGAFNGHESWVGTVAVGVVNGDGDVLLVNAPEGWSLPRSPVRPGDDWGAVARRWVAQKTGLAVSLERPERVTRTSYRLAGAEYRQTTGYDVVLRAEPVDSAVPENANTPMDHLSAKRASEEGDEWDARWFGCVPDGVAERADGEQYWNGGEREDAVSDVEWFLEE
ncbi:hypothetical protein [Halobacterium zhouii]|uniref:hypothetical protein n=1 Tax=Halobacterium zhouii TaxID=2902624 RepID=UPI001E3F4D81|nr:hypothetical protein [Halobacterium zhouii]